MKEDSAAYMFGKQNPILKLVSGIRNGKWFLYPGNTVYGQQLPNYPNGLIKDDTYANKLLPYNNKYYAI